MCYSQDIFQDSLSASQATSSQTPCVLTLEDLAKGVVVSSAWIYHAASPLDRIQFLMIEEVAITHSVSIYPDFSWSVHIHGHQIDPQACLPGIPARLELHTLQLLLSTIDNLHVCAGHPDAHFLEMAEAIKGTLKSINCSVAAYVDNNAPVEVDGKNYIKTLRSSGCHLLCTTSKCSVCVSYRDNIRAMYHKWIKSSKNMPSTSASASSHVNDRWMRTPERREKAASLKRRMRSAESTVKYMKKKIASSTDKNGVSVDDSLHDGLRGMMSEFSVGVEEKFAENSFHRLFWDQQMKMLTKEPRQRRWHPMLIRWCLHLKKTSSAAYNSLRRILTLPCGRTLQVLAILPFEGGGVNT